MTRGLQYLGVLDHLGDPAVPAVFNYAQPCLEITTDKLLEGLSYGYTLMSSSMSVALHSAGAGPYQHQGIYCTRAESSLSIHDGRPIPGGMPLYPERLIVPHVMSNFRAGFISMC